MHCDIVQIPVDAQQHIAGTFAFPDTGVPGILFLHGWSGSQDNDIRRAQDIAALGCVCLTFDLRGHGRTETLRQTITPEENLQDALAAYDLLVAQPAIDKSAIAVVGSSYGAYLGTILSSLRPVKWLSLRAPSIYRDQHWTVPKGKLDRTDLTLYREQRIEATSNRALDACSQYAGNVLLVESEHDALVPHPTIASYLEAFRAAKSMTYRIIAQADHALSDEGSRQAYNALLLTWIREMVLGAR
jgi:pimeloyl-ACP methyl ester carboxylesterase